MQRPNTTSSAVRNQRVDAPPGAFPALLLAAFWATSCGRLGVEILPLADFDAPSPITVGDGGVERDSAVDPQSGVDSGCAGPCSNEHGAAECVGGQCSTRCQVGYADCDGNVANGCETSTSDDVLGCGGCNVQCTTASGSTACTNGICTPTCVPGRSADCDGDPRNGCETDLANNPNHCGSCGSTCDPSLQACTDGTCQVSMCLSGTGDCDQNRSDCETDLTRSPTSCGFCGNRCTNAHGSTSCASGSCAPSCASGWGSCDSNPSNGCESALSTVTDCGTCGNVCPNAMANASAACNAGVCGYSCTNLAGVYALRLRMQVSWPATQWVSSGSGIAERWLRVALDQAGTTVSGSVAICGATMPEFRNSVVADRYFFRHAATAFDAAIPSVPFSATLGSTAPSASLASARSAILMGLSMSDPLNGTWLTPTQARAGQVDHDSDGEVGVTIAYLNDSTYSYVQTAGTFTAARASHSYTAERLRFSLNGALTGCTGAAGSANVQSLDTRTFGCRLASGPDCSSTQYGHLESNGPIYNVSSATYSMTRVANVGATVSCAQVRAAL